MRLQASTLTFPQYKRDAAGNVFMKTVETDRQALCWGIWGQGDFFPNLKLELTQRHSLSLHSTPGSPWAHHEGGAPALTGAASWPEARPRCPRGAFSCPIPVQPHSGEFPSGQTFRKEEGKRAPTGLCPQLPGPAPSTASPGHAFFKEAAHNLLRWQFSLPGSPGVDHGRVDRGQG